MDGWGLHIRMEHGAFWLENRNVEILAWINGKKLVNVNWMMEMLRVARPENGNKIWNKTEIILLFNVISNLVLILII